MIKYIAYLKNIALFLSIIFVFSCEDEIAYDLPTGQLIGYVDLIKNNYYSNDHSGVKVTVEGSDPLMEVTTDTAGKYIINDLKAGTYNFIFSKDGYGTYKMYGEKFVGGDKPGVLSTAVLIEYSDATLDSIALFSTDNFGKLSIAVSVFPSEEADLYYLRYYISDTPDVSYLNYKQTEDGDLFYRRGILQFNVADADTTKYPVGSEIYLIAYPVPRYHSYSYYIDLDSGLEIYPAVNPDNASNVLTITIPEPYTNY